MIKYYKDYYWRDGIPRGIQAMEHPEGKSYKIVMDPYRRRISLELYKDIRFTETIYDSALVNFRHLKPEEQAAWQKETIKENQDEVSCLIRNQDDRVIFLETHFFEGNQCKECHIFSPQGTLIGIQKIQRVSKGNAFNGVILFDANHYPVMFKRYEVDDEEFTELLEESWDMQNQKFGVQ